MSNRYLTLILPLMLLIAACQPTPSPTATPIAPITVTPSPTPPITATPSPTATALFPTAPLPLSHYPRPKKDNGLGIHWSTHLYAQSEEATTYFVNELTAMNIKWVKLLVDGTANYDYDPTLEALIQHDIMPIIRIYQRCNTPYHEAELTQMVQHYVAKGVYYYEIYNEPNLSGERGGWCQPGGEPQPEYLAETWAKMARLIYLAGGYPSVPSFFAPSQKRDGWQNDFFYRFYQTVRAQGNESVLYFSWAAIHNYTLNHPSNYPYDAANLTDRPLTETEIAQNQLTPEQVKTINEARRTAHEPGGFFLGDNLYDDSTNFFHFIAYRNQFYDLFGFDLPLISTEGGATRGSSEDPRYPPMTGSSVASHTIWAADYMLTDAPDYYFATTTWLLAQQALEYNDPVWESNAWYHDRQGQQEPVVAALKQRPQREAVRQNCFATMDWQPEQNPHNNACEAQKAKTPPTLSLNSYPRPPQDNGRGVHGSPSTHSLSPEVADYFVAELVAMKIKWYKLLQTDSPQINDPYLVQQLVSHDIEPIMRIYQPYNERYQHIPELVTAAQALGIHYFELYNEPNIAGAAGGWQEGEPVSVGRMVDLWLLAAREVEAAGGHPSLPPLAGGGTIDDIVFLRDFLAEIRARDQSDILPGAWIAMHNYFLNHPLDYPADEVNVHDVLLSEAEIARRQLTFSQVTAINHARQVSKLPREQGGFWVGNTIDEDSNSFGKFAAYQAIFQARFGYTLPIISTEGGAILGAAEDPRYPPVNEADLVTLTLAAYNFMETQAPPYFFAHTSWLLANQAMNGQDERFESAAWYKDTHGQVLPLVPALKANH